MLVSGRVCAVYQKNTIFIQAVAEMLQVSLADVQAWSKGPWECQAQKN